MKWWVLILLLPLVSRAQSILNVRDYGATGNGGDDDRAAFVSAMADATVGTVIEIPAGNYRIASGDEIAVPRGVTMRGAGRNATVIRPERTWTGLPVWDRFDHPVFELSDGCVVTDMRFDCVDSVSAVFVSRAKKGITYERLDFYVFRSKGSFITSYSGRNTFRDCSFTNIDGDEAFSCYQYNNCTFPVNKDTSYWYSCIMQSGIYCYGGSTNGYSEMYDCDFWSTPTIGGDALDLYGGSECWYYGGTLRGKVAAGTIVWPDAPTKLHIVGTYVHASSKFYSSDWENPGRLSADSVWVSDCQIDIDSCLAFGNNTSVGLLGTMAYMNFSNTVIRYLRNGQGSIHTFPSVPDTCSHYVFNNVQIENVGLKVWNTETVTPGGKVLVEANNLTVTVPASAQNDEPVLYLQGLKAGSYFRNCTFADGRTDGKVPFDFSANAADSVVEFTNCAFRSSWVHNSAGPDAHPSAYVKGNFKFTGCTFDFGTSPQGVIALKDSSARLTLTNCQVVGGGAYSLATHLGTKPGSVISEYSTFSPMFFKNVNVEFTAWKNNSVPVIHTTPVLRGHQDSTYVYRVYATDQDSSTYGDVVRYRLSVGPGWLSIDSIGGLITGTPGSNNVGDTLVVVQAYDKMGGGEEQRFTVHVRPPNRAPQFVCSPVTEAREDSIYRYQFVATDPDTAEGDVLTYSVLSRPSWLSFEALNRTFLGVPGVANIGDTVLSMKVDDGHGGTANQTFTLRVIHTNHSPVFLSKPDTLAVEDSSYIYQARATDRDSARFGDIVRYRLSVWPRWLTIDSIAGILGGTPSGFNARDTVVAIEAYDNKGGVQEQRFLLRVEHVNHPPVITATLLPDAAEDTPFRAQVIAHDQDSLLFGDRLKYHKLNGPAWLVIDSTLGNLSGAPQGTDVGISSVTVQVTDGVGGSTVHTYDLKVVHTNHAPQFVSPPDTLAVEDGLYEYKAFASDRDSALFGDILRYRFSVNPGWLTINDSTGLVSGRPEAVNVRDTTVGIVAYDGKGGEAEQQYILHVKHVNHDPVIDSTLVPDAKEDSVYTFQVEARDQDCRYFGDILRYQKTSGPAWLSIDSVSGQVTGVPAATDVGAMTFAVSVTDNQGGSAQRTYESTVLHTNHSPLIVSQPDTSVAEDSLYQYAAYAIDKDSLLFGDVVRYRLVTRPGWLTIDSVSGIIQGTPLAGNVGANAVVVEAYDNKGGSSEQRFTVYVSHTNHPPRVTSFPSLHATEDVPFEYGVVAEDQDRKGWNDTISYSMLSAPDWLQMDRRTGMIGGTPRGRDVGPSSVTVRVSDGCGGADTATFEIDVKHVNHPPVFNRPAAATAWEWLPFTFSANAADQDSALFGDEVTYRFLAAPSWLTLNRSNGLVQGTPGNENVDTVFTVVATDGLLSDTLSVALHVSPVNDPPQVTPLPAYSLPEDSVLRIDLRTWYSLVQDPDNEDSVLTWTVRPGNHAAPRVTGRVLELNPEADWFGRDSLQVIVSDPAGLADTTSLSITVLPVNDPPSVRGIPDILFDEDSSATVSLDSYVHDVDDDLTGLAWSFSIAAAGDSDGSAIRQISKMTAAPACTEGDGAGEHNVPGSLSVPSQTSASPWNLSTVKGQGRTTSILTTTTLGMTDSLIIAVDSVTHVATFRSTFNFFRSNIPVVLVATDRGGLSGSDTVRLTVKPLNDPPHLEPLPATTLNAADTLVFPVSSWYPYLSDPDDPDSAHTWEVIGAQKLSIDMSMPMLEVKSKLRWAGAETLMVVVRDPGGLSDTTSWVVKVSAPNVKPQIFSTPAKQTTVGKTYQYVVRATDADPGDSLFTYTLFGPSWLHIDSHGLLSGVSPSPGTYTVRIVVQDVCMAADTQMFALEVTSLTAVDEGRSGLPSSFALHQNYPNPFNPVTQVQFDLPEAVPVTLTLYDVTGREVGRCVDEVLAAGYHTIHLSSDGLASGAYFYKLQAGKFVETRKMLVLR